MEHRVSTQWPSTRPSLLGELRSGRDEAWRTFVELYVPLMVRFCRRLGARLEQVDVHEAINRVLLKMSRFEYRPEKGRFRDWLRTVLRHEIRRELAKQGGRMDAARGGADPPEFEGLEARDDRAWDAVFIEHVRRAAVARVRGRFSDEEWRAFEARAPWQTEPKGVEEIARELGRSKAWVSKTCAKIEKALMDEVRYLSEELPPGDDPPAGDPEGPEAKPCATPPKP